MAALHVEDSGVLLRGLGRGVDGRLESDHPAQACALHIVQCLDRLPQSVCGLLLLGEFRRRLLGLLPEQAHGVRRELLLELGVLERRLVLGELARELLRVPPTLPVLGSQPLHRGGGEVGLVVLDEVGERRVDRAEILLGLLDGGGVPARPAHQELLHLVRGGRVGERLHLAVQAVEIRPERLRRLARHLARLAQLGEGTGQLVDVRGCRPAALRQLRESDQ